MLSLFWLYYDKDKEMLRQEICKAMCIWLLWTAFDTFHISREKELFCWWVSTYQEQDVIVDSKSSGSIRSAVIGSIPRLRLWTPISNHDTSYFYSSHMVELKGDIIRSTTSACFKSLRVALISDILFWMQYHVWSIFVKGRIVSRTCVWPYVPCYGFYSNRRPRWSFLPGIMCIYPCCAPQDQQSGHTMDPWTHWIHWREKSFNLDSIDQ